jgi:large subunit ribosomal protein L25
MAEVRLAAESKRPVGSRSSRRLRSAGRVPAVVYGHGIEPVPVDVDARALRAALTTEAGLNALVVLEVDGGTHLTLPREVQRHPVRGTVSHVDFQVVRRDEVMTAEVAVHLRGEAEAVHRADGVVEHMLHSLAVQATPDKIPYAIEVDISGMSIGDTIRVGDLPLPDGVSTEVDPDEPVVVAQGSTLSAEAEALETEAGAGAEGAPEGGEGGGAGGAGPSGGGAAEG